MRTSSGELASYIRLDYNNFNRGYKNSNKLSFDILMSLGLNKEGIIYTLYDTVRGCSVFNLNFYGIVQLCNNDISKLSGVVLQERVHDCNIYLIASSKRLYEFKKLKPYLSNFTIEADYMKEVATGLTIRNYFKTDRINKIGDTGVFKIDDRLLVLACRPTASLTPLDKNGLYWSAYDYNMYRATDIISIYLSIMTTLNDGVYENVSQIFVFNEQRMKVHILNFSNDIKRFLIKERILC
jgi:hypothetical protein